MPDIPFFQVDAFADGPFSGNPAAVCLMSKPAGDTWLQSVAAEMNLSETAFIWKQNGHFHLRWFTPAVEVDLCGHATMAAAHALWESGWLNSDSDAEFATRSGKLVATRDDGKIRLDFPIQPAAAVELPATIQDAVPVHPEFVGKNQADYLIQVATEKEVREVEVDFQQLAQATDVRGLILTGPSDSNEFDFVSRFFAPACGINEDPVTGSAHCCLAPFWSAKLDRRELIGFQASERGGVVTTALQGERVMLGGSAVTVIRGSLVV